MTRTHDLDRLYRLLDRLAERVDGPLRLEDCDGRLDWPERGVVLFLSPEETRGDGDQRRVTYVDTHAVESDDDGTLWDQLRAHRGTVSGKYADGGDHRTSPLRRRVGAAMLRREDLAGRYAEWGEGASNPDRREHEHPHEKRVSTYVRDLPFLWVAVDDAPGPDSDRAFLARHLVGLLSNVMREAIDPRAAGWLGKHSPEKAVRTSGLWNVEHVRVEHDHDVLRVLEDHVERTEPVS